MFRGNVVCLALLALTAAGNSLAQQQNQQSHEALMQQAAQAYSRSEANANAWDRDYDRRSVKAMADLPRVRAHLTKVWQQFGLSAKDAEVVASAYRVSDAGMDRASSLIGKSDAEIASMLQSALSTKNYALANMLMINYEKKRIHATTGN